MVRICTVLLTVALAAPSWGQLPPNVAKNAKAASAAASTRPAKRYYGKSKPPAAKQAPAPEPQPTPAQPVVPLRPSQMPSVPPRVSFQQGQLTVIAENSTLGDIFGAIRNATGIKIETQGGPSGDRVAAKIGPAPAKEVLLSLLQGSRYDYVMLGSLTDPEQVERVILTPKSAGGTQTASAPAPPAPQQARPDMDQDANNEENADEEDPGNPPVRGPDRPQPEQPGAAVQPAPNTQVQPQNPQNPPTNPNPNGQVKSPEQLLQELRERQQIQQQQQQQQSDPNRPR